MIINRRDFAKTGLGGVVAFAAGLAAGIASSRTGKTTVKPKPVSWYVNSAESLTREQAKYLKREMNALGLTDGVRCRVRIGSEFWDIGE